MFAAQTPLGAQPDFGPCYDTGDLQVESRIRILFIYLFTLYLPLTVYENSRLKSAMKLYTSTNNLIDVR